MEIGKMIEVEQTAIIKYGDEHQKAKCIEEMAELTKELCKDLIGEGNRDHILEELADAMITLDEISIIYGFTVAEVDGYMDEKLKRLSSRMEAEDCIEQCDNSAHVDMAYEK